MALFLLGLNHRTAPVELREQLALADCGLRMALEELTTDRSADLRELVILSTCNRLEVYGVASDVDRATARVTQSLAGLNNLSPEILTPHLYQAEETDAAHHLMRVACGLDSQILGEPQILGQVTRAFEQARGAGVTSAVLSALFRRAIRAGKRARAETAISRATTSVSHAAIDLALSARRNTEPPRILLVGAGEMMEAAAKALIHRGVQEAACINRTYTRAEALARRMNGRAFSWRELREALAWADVVLTGTGAPHTVIHAEDVEPVLLTRTRGPLIFVDVAVPRDVADDVNGLPGVRCFDIDDLQAALDANLSLRQGAVPQVEAIVAEELAAFTAWLQSRQVVPTIVHLRDKVSRMAEQETALALQRLPDLSPQEQAVIEKLVHRLVNKFLHEPTVRLKALATKDDADYAGMARILFGLDELEAGDEPLALQSHNNGAHAPAGVLRNGHARKNGMPVPTIPVAAPLLQPVISHGDD